MGAFLKRSVMGREVVAVVTNGAFDFGPWEQDLCGEFDGGTIGSILLDFPSITTEEFGRRVLLGILQGDSAANVVIGMAFHLSPDKQ